MSCYHWQLEEPEHKLTRKKMRWFVLSPCSIHLSFFGICSVIKNVITTYGEMLAGKRTQTQFHYVNEITTFVSH
jgi:hypothetical protein